MNGVTRCRETGVAPDGRAAKLAIVDIGEEGMPMRSHELGRTGLIVTPLGLGLAALGRPGYITLAERRTLAAIARSGKWSVGATRSSRPPTTPAFAMLTPPDRTGWPKPFWRPGSMRAAAANRDDDRVEVGLQLHRRVAPRRARARAQGSLGRDAAASTRGEPRDSRRARSASIKSIGDDRERRSRRPARPRRTGAAGGRGSRHRAYCHRPETVGHDSAGPRRQDRRRESFPDRSGDLERARAVGGLRIGGGTRCWLGRHRQRGTGEWSSEHRLQGTIVEDGDRCGSGVGLAGRRRGARRGPCESVGRYRVVRRRHRPAGSEEQGSARIARYRRSTCSGSWQPPSDRSSTWDTRRDLQWT